MDATGPFPGPGMDRARGRTEISAFRDDGETHGVPLILEPEPSRGERGCEGEEATGALVPAGRV